jgi:hypothetical protein
MPLVSPFSDGGVGSQPGITLLVWPCLASPREAPPESAITPKPASSDSAHAYQLEAEACARRNYTYAMYTDKDG